MHSGIFHQPFHSTNDIGLGRKSSRVPCIICQDKNVLFFKFPVLFRACHVSVTVSDAEGIKPTDEEIADVLSVVHTAI